MEYRNLGKSGLRVSAIGLGTNQFGGKVDQQTTADIVHAAVDAGINFIDTADIYQDGRSEAYLGKALQGKRQDVILATKVFFPVSDRPNDRGASRQHILRGVENSLQRLGVETIDLYQIHRWDDKTPIEETLRALDDLIRSGKVRYIGASNFSAWQLTHANALAELQGWSRFVSIQPHYNMLVRKVEEEMLPACEYFGIGVLPYFPLAGGFLTGKYRAGEPIPEGSRGEQSEYVQDFMTEENFQILSALIDFAQSRGHSLTELAHAWLLSRPQVSSVISGATRVDQVLANARSAGWELSPEEADRVDEILAG